MTVCRFFIGPAGAAACKRPGCGASWRDHYGDPPRDPKKRDQPLTSRNRKDPNAQTR